MYQFHYWCFVPALTDTMPGLLKHPTATYGWNQADLRFKNVH